MYFKRFSLPELVYLSGVSNPKGVRYFSHHSLYFSVWDLGQVQEETVVSRVMKRQSYTGCRVRDFKCEARGREKNSDIPESSAAW